MKKLIILLIPLLIFGLIFIKTDQEVFAQNSYSEIVIDKDSGRILYENNSELKKYPASTTKILTAITVIENVDLYKEITVKKETVGIEGSSIYLKEGEKFTVKELLYGLMLRSGNDCAETLAEIFGRERFIELMNQTAKKAGAISSKFINPHGLHDDNHYVTAKDLAFISRYAMNNEVFKEIVSTKNIKIGTGDSTRYLKNKNKMLFNFNGSNGVKTGYTKKAGRCLVSSAERNGKEFICVVLDCPPMFERSTELLNDCFNKYANYKILDKKNIVGFIKSEDNNRLIPLEIKNDLTLPLTAEEYKSLKIIYDYPKTIKKGTKKDAEIGNVKILIGNNLIFTEKIYTIIDV